MGCVSNDGVGEAVSRSTSLLLTATGSIGDGVREESLRLVISCRAVICRLDEGVRCTGVIRLWRDVIAGRVDGTDVVVEADGVSIFERRRALGIPLFRVGVPVEAVLFREILCSFRFDLGTPLLTAVGIVDWEAVARIGPLAEVDSFMSEVLLDEGAFRRDVDSAEGRRLGTCDLFCWLVDDGGASFGFALA